MEIEDKPAVATTLLEELAHERRSFVAFARQRAPWADSEDLVQQAFTRAQEKIHTLRDPKNAKAWFYRILRRLIADHFSSRAAASGKLDELAAQLPEMAEEDLAVCACALGLMGTLKDTYRDILERVDVRDESLSVAADLLSISRNNAAVRLHRARGVLREKLLDHCGSGAPSACSMCDCAPAKL